MSASQERPPRSVAYLISSLVRFSEIGSVKYDPRQQTIKIGLLLTGTLTAGEFEQFRKVLSDTLEVYHLLDHRQLAVAAIDHEACGDLTAISVTRDVGTLTPAEAWTLLEFFRDRFPGRLVAEPVEYQGEDEWIAQDEMIEEMLVQLRRGKTKGDLIAIRADGRLMVFHK